ncbi:hypothetical protein Sango_1896500 [Sesamum angolense]|uniref:Reverse transcriptase domain-containing protein n=1 Tax=Sesamum angolense TaxID=2727404 RepID=A0AAE1WJB9_9LAMI|nr:hypothetical protein Sango_1896500 [Sesamum angolense]
MARPVKQKKMSFGAKRNYIIEEEVNKLVKAGFVFEARPTRLVNRIFNDQIGASIEVYVDDMFVKSKRESDHIAHLKQAFEVMRTYGVKLNPTKYTFGVRGGRFLGYMVSKRESKPIQRRSRRS